jgi:arylsulfatase A-like enzyme
MLRHLRFIARVRQRRLIAGAAFACVAAPNVFTALRAQRPGGGGASARPNVVLIITDDMGYADIGPYGARDIRTPHLDRLAREGTTFTAFYANGVLCTPTRAGLITGRYQQRYGLEDPLGNPTAGERRGLVATGTSLPQLLRQRGYATALVGKWHLGYDADMSPNAHGFDWFWGLKSGYHDYYRHTDGAGKPDLFENDVPVTADGYSTDLIAAKAVSFIEQHRATPFFIDVAFNAPHWPFQRPDAPAIARENARLLSPSDSAPGTRADYVRMVERMDRGVGDVLRTLDRLGLARNTIVIFTNDNGGEWLSDNGPLFNRKYTVWEGGIRVPAIVRWPGRVLAGRRTAQVGITMDLTASVLAATGTTVPEAARLEGIDLFPVLAGTRPPVPRTLFWRSTFEGRTQRAVREGAWKYVRDANHDFVFEVANDPGERHDLARQRPDVARRLRERLLAWEQEVDAEAHRLRAARTTKQGT